MSTDEDKLDCALDLIRRLPPTKIASHLHSLTTSIIPHLTEDLLSSVDQPLIKLTCAATGRDYLICDYNRDANSYRSPWSNEYDPPCPDGMKPSAPIRVLEISANDAFDTYRELYFEGGSTSSVYMWDLDGGFAAVVLVKKVSDDGTWDSIHVIEATPKSRSCNYKLTSTIMLQMSSAALNLGGNITRQSEHENVTMEDGHVANIGRLVEDMEYKLRNSLSEIYFGKTRDIASDLRQNLESVKEMRAIQEGVVKGLKK